MHFQSCSSPIPAKAPTFSVNQTKVYIPLPVLQSTVTHVLFFLFCIYACGSKLCFTGNSLVQDLLSSATSLRDSVASDALI